MIGTKVYKSHIEENGWVDYTAMARWCNETQQGTIADQGEYYECVERVEDPRRVLEREITELEDWFVWYDRQVMQYNRSQRLNTTRNIDINSLDCEAETKALRLSRLRRELSSL